MILHLRQMEHGSLHLAGSESSVHLDLLDSGVKSAGELEYALEAGLSGGGVWVAGSLRLPVTLECVKCLEPVHFLVEVPHFAVQVQLEETGGRESIDLTPWAREDILLALPPYPKCDLVEGQDCRARFPSMEFAPSENEPEEQNPVWAALDALGEKSKSEN